MAGLYFQETTMKGNKVVDKLDNEGTDGTLCLKSQAWKELEEGELHQQCESINEEDNYSIEQ